MKLKDYIILSILGGAIIFSSLWSVKEEKTLEGISDSSCTITHTTTAIGNELATTALASAPNRAWAVIEQPVNATNTVSVNLGGTAVSGAGYILLDIATSTGSADRLTFGLNAELPYAGAVSVITNVGSSTIRTTQCLY